jgi:hypothetical protein
MYILYYDPISKMFSLLDNKENKTTFLGPLTHALLKLEEYGLNELQAREAILRAFHGHGDPVELNVSNKYVG